MSSLTRQQEAEIFPILDKALALPQGKAIIYPCSRSRANYLERMISGFRYDNAIESIEMYSPEEPLYGQGNYALLWAEEHPKGLVLAHLDAPRDTLAWRLIQVAAFHRPLKLNNAYGTCRTRLARFRKRHPVIMAPVWIEAGPPIIARYGEASPEELVVVDIDVDPSLKLRSPTQEDRAKLRQ